ncbi:MupA/Atu3671 family FMN-dependent luciferase-like monooxygenase [Pyxidicoccus xibeiensis]|uniref:MupA/Atu3671 family FMN-dependent luciferase-like monooxygenase n=1 Tax=Pyxidicoccus xibeiensis TaxID=2906759 RepID=UPI0020A8379D|nr:MupA/Atu3671 family FMN-dependent luciferase-like monooxygenase [Pyxidicoccus xibeiensis]MCP3140915.1 LLM class flavin-dependent oxidoreductase [Pyxidicoccus xibeiensis]
MSDRNEKAASEFPTLVELLRYRADRKGDALLYRFLETGDVDGGVEEWSYTRLDTRARALGALLRESGAAGERALLLYPPGMEFVAGFMGCLYGGVVAVPCYPPDPTRLERTLPRLRAIAQDSGAKYVLTTSFILEMSELFKPQAPELGELQWLASDAVPEARAADWKLPETDTNGIAFLQYTSGSTGNPKGVMVSHGNILHNEALITRGFNLEASRSSGMGWLPMFHDMGLIGKVLQPMYLGFPCTLMSPIAFLQRPLRWLEAISHFKATCSGGPNFAYDLCVRKATDADRERLDLSSWALAFNGAEPVRRETLERFADAFAPCGFKSTAFYPCYGLAEATLIVTGGTQGEPVVQGRFDAEALEHGRAVDASDQDEGPKARTLVGAGRSALDQRMLIVHPETRVPCATHAVGEIWVSGPSVAQGYWARPEETAHAFDARLASGEGPYLRTGDLGFVNADGELFVTGRLKDLLIIRGRNLYPQDLELATERAHRAVRPGCCAAFSVDVEGEERLVVAAEVDMRDGFDAAAVVEAVRGALAEEHSVHAHGVVLLQARSIPKTSSGKIQRRATRAAYLAGELEVVEASVVTAEAPAVTEPAVPLKEQLATASEAERAGVMERFLRNAVARVLRVDAATLAGDTDLAGLGLDSLMVLELHGQLESGLGVQLPAAFLWQSPTLGAAAAHLLETWKGVRPVSALVAPPLVAGPADAEAPLSSGQLRLWFLDRLVPETPLYNVHFQLHLTGPLDEAALRTSLNALVERHPVLRTAFPEADGQPRRAPRPSMALELPKSDLRALAPDARQAELHRLSLAQAREPFNLAEGPLTRAALVALRDEEHVLLMTQHHIVTDGWSIGVLAHELAALYRAAVAGAAVTLPSPTLHYADFARWQQGLGSLLDGQRAYWAQRLAGLPRLELPTDFPRPKEPGFQGAVHRLTLPRPLVENLRALGRREGCTLFVTLAAAWTALLNRYSGQEDFGLGTVVAQRDRPELRDVVGFFAHTLVLRGDVSGQPTFRELLARTRRTFHEALAHADLPFEEVVGAARVARGADNPLFQTSLLLEVPPPTDLAVPGMEWKPVLPVPDGAVEGTSKFDLQLSLVETPDGLTGALEYRTDLFAPSTPARLAGHLETLLRAVVDAPDARVEDLPLLTEGETRRLLVDWNDLTPPAPEDAALCIHAQFRAQAARTPDAVAVAGDDETLSYTELDRRSDALAWHLRGLGVGPEVRVGLCVERSARMVVAMLGVLKAGGAYVPLDPDYPRERLAYMLEDSGAAVLLTESHLDGTVPAGRARTVLLDGPDAPGAVSSDGPPPSGTGPANLAYVIYTSGSTGRPKGVMVPHGGVANFFTAMDARVGNQPAGSWLAVTSISFDISVLELLWTLTRGFKVVVQGEGALLKAPARVSAARRKPAEFSLFYFADDADDAGGNRYRLLLEGAKFADKNGFAAVWTPERHFHAFGGLYPNPSVAGAAIAAVTERVGIRAGSVVLPLHHPVRVAEEWALVDNLSRGRVGISVASGWHANDFVFAPERYEQRRELMLSGLDTVRRLWRGETVRLPGGAGTQVDVTLRPKPLQAELPVWLTAAGNPDTFVSAGQLGCHVLTHLLGQTWEDLEKKLTLYRDAWRAAGHPGDGHVTLMLHTFIGEDAGKVRAVVEQPFKNYLKSSADLMRGLAGTLGLDMKSAAFTEADLDRLAAHAFDRYFETSGLFGTPRSVRDQVEKLKASGVDEVGCLIDFGIPADTVLASLPLLNEVKARSDRDSRRSGGARPIPLQLREHAVTHLQCTPSLARALLADAESAEALGGVRRLMVGGEALPSSLAASLRQGLPEGSALLNMYGPTETTIWSSTQDVKQEAGPVASIGTPFSRTQFYVVDAKLRPVPVGVPGELYIGGAGVVRGYLARPELTAERFVPDPFSKEPGARLYRTGDRARWREDGTVEFLGRVDYQLKVRGFRIEAGEIEAVLTAQPAVREAVVVAREDDPGDVRLVAYVVAREGQPVDATALRDAVALRLPEHMVPSLVVELAALPLTPNGKVDRKALPAPTAARTSRTAFVAPQSQLEQQIAEVWRKVLKVEQVGVHDNFFDLGGHSLLMVQVHTQLKAALGQDVQLLKLLEHPTISALARYLRQEPASGAAPVEAAQDRAKKQLESLKRQQQRARKQG